MAPPTEPIEVIAVLTTCPNDAVAARIARELVESGLAACVNRVAAVHSTYRWQGAMQDEPEVLLIIKTLSSRYSELEMRLKSLHPYDVPEIIALPVTRGSAEYLAWLGGAAAL
ncbi:MAG TPA: divalent-cation tolerance protein CutA [Steroidobacteraceae bacterium]|nr:divalent-cation tolerance protein CutA [Steroidobacteraceae bacterium]